ncbi:ABC transporter permease [Anaerosporobacter sp.]|uniref:ABC transporter permease n=1 Tax=Anaerosporobacter sp. TaxID=1872529 RepID=UPI00286FA55E|nr:ABC transporter permease [Anaerosporobacter sp.]
MSSYWAFTKKEFLGCFRTSKLVVMAVVFLLLGIMNPVTAKLMPELFKSLNTEGIIFTIPEPTALDSWMQFYKNVPQMGLIVLVIVFSGVLTNEISKGTLINVLTKGLKRSNVILAKMTMVTAVWTMCYILAFVVTYGYTVYFWPEQSCNNIVLAAVCLWLFGVLLLSAIMLGSVLVKGTSGCLLFVGGVVVLMFLINMIPKADAFNPIVLAAGNMNLITGAMAVGDLVKPIVVSVVLIIGFLGGACSVFNRKYI